MTSATNSQTTTEQGSLTKIMMCGDDHAARLEVHSNRERKVTGKDYVLWGEKNLFPQYLQSRYLECATLNSIINGMVLYILGDGIEINAVKPETSELMEQMNADGDDISDVISKCALDLCVFGGMATEVIYNYGEGISDIYPKSMTKVRVSEDESKFYLSPDWTKARPAIDRRPAFDRDADDRKAQIYYYKGSSSLDDFVYPIPMYYGSLTDIETQIKIHKYHYNAITNNFSDNVIITISGDIPTDEEKAYIEREINNKFAGEDNAGRVMMIWNSNQSEGVQVDRLSSDNFDQKYNALSIATRQNIYASFRAIPSLFGIMTETTGFSAQEFSEAFKLFNKTVIAPMQKEIVRYFDYLFDEKNCITFKPFTINFSDEQ